jgi:FkbM family methyltransferase
MILSARRVIARGIRSALASRGFELLRKGVAPSWETTVGLLKRYGVAPRTVFDIGVAEGTPELHSAFPDAEYHLFDPTRESLPHMQAIARRLNATVHNIALGDREGTMTIAVRSEIGGSSVFEEVGEPEAPVTDRYEVPIRRFDEVVGEFTRPALAKIDVQGAEVMVLKGMEGRFADLDAVIVETGTIATLHGGPEFRDVFRLLDGHGFVLWDIVRLARRPLDSTLAQFDRYSYPRIRRCARTKDGRGQSDAPRQSGPPPKPVHAPGQSPQANDAAD